MSEPNPFEEKYRADFADQRLKSFSAQMLLKYFLRMIASKKWPASPGLEKELNNYLVKISRAKEKRG